VNFLCEFPSNFFFMSIGVAIVLVAIFIIIVIVVYCSRRKSAEGLPQVKLTESDIEEFFSDLLMYTIHRHINSRISN